MEGSNGEKPRRGIAVAAIVCLLAVLLCAFLLFRPGADVMKMQNAEKDCFAEATLLQSTEVALTQEQKEKILDLHTYAMCGADLYYLERAVSPEGTPVWYLSRADLMTGEEEMLCQLDMGKQYFSDFFIEDGKLLFYCTETDLGKPVRASMLSYDLGDGTLSTVGEIPVGLPLDSAGYEEGTLYWFTGFETSALESWTRDAGFHTAVKSVYGEIGWTRICDGVIGMQSEDRGSLLRFDCAGRKLLDKVGFPDGMRAAYVQADRAYAMWCDAGGIVYVYDYERKELLPLKTLAGCEAGILADGVRMELFGDTAILFHDGTLHVYDLEARERESFQVQTGSVIAVDGADGADGAKVLLADGDGEWVYCSLF